MLDPKITCSSVVVEGFGKKEEGDLRLYWDGQEAAVGLSSSYGAGVNRAMGLAATTSFTPYEGFFCWQNPLRRAFARVHAALRCMRHRDQGPLVGVLHRVYGPRIPSAPVEIFGELAPLAAWTRAVAAEGRRLAKRLASARIAAMLLAEERRRAAGGEPLTPHAIARATEGILITSALEVTAAAALASLLAAGGPQAFVAIRDEAAAMLQRAKRAYVQALEDA
jgi:hypothetical protein